MFKYTLFSSSFTSFIKENKMLILISLGIVILSSIKFLGKTISWIKSPQGTTKKVNTLKTGMKKDSNITINNLSKLSSFQENKTPFIDRKTPPLSDLGYDTVIIVNGKIQSAHPDVKFIPDEEIVKVYDFIPEKQKQVKEGECSVSIDFTINGKAVIQQQAKRGCTAAVSAMLIYDNDKKFALEDLLSRNLGQNDTILYDIEKAGLEPTEERIENANPIVSLKQAIEKAGSAIITVTDESIGGHVIMVDHIDLEKNIARIRDPYHGWEIDITLEALQKRFRPKENIIQIQK